METPVLEWPKDVVVVFGGKGGLGSRVCPILASHFSVFALNSQDVDILNIDQIESILDKLQPTHIINMAVKNSDSLIAKLDNTTQLELVDSNIHGAINLLKSSIRYFRNIERKGSFTYISSVLSSRPVKGAGMYSGVKSFNEALIRSAALENARYNIRCNSVSLGYFMGGLTERLPEIVTKNLNEKIPLGHLGQPRDLAEMLKMIMNNRYLTGSSLELGGGIHL